jgi:hypothetical protein
MNADRTQGSDPIRVSLKWEKETLAFIVDPEVLVASVMMRISRRYSRTSAGRPLILNRQSFPFIRHVQAFGALQNRGSQVLEYDLIYPVLDKGSQVSEYPSHLLVRKGFVQLLLRFLGVPELSNIAKQFLEFLLTALGSENPFAQTSLGRWLGFPHTTRNVIF